MTSRAHITKTVCFLSRLQAWPQKERLGASSGIGQIRCQPRRCRSRHGQFIMLIAIIGLCGLICGRRRARFYRSMYPGGRARCSTCLLRSTGNADSQCNLYGVQPVKCKAQQTAHIDGIIQLDAMRLAAKKIDLQKLSLS